MLIKLYLISNWLYKNKIPYLPKIIKAIIYIFFHCVIPPECVIGKGTNLWHNGLGIIIHPDVIIGKNCSIYNHVVIGGGHDGPDGPPIQIVIGNDVIISTGSKILSKEGLLTIGDNSTIAANSVVLDNVPPNTLVGGIPAKILKKK